MSGNKISSVLLKIVIIVIFLVITSFFLYSSIDEGFQKDSEDLAVGPIYAKIMKIDIDTEDYGLGRLISTKYSDDFVYDLVNSKEECYESGYEYCVYKSQVGLQGIVYHLRATAFTFLLFAT